MADCSFFFCSLSHNVILPNLADLHGILLLRGKDLDIFIPFFFVGGRIGKRVSCATLLAFEGCYRQLDRSPDHVLNLSLVCHFKYLVGETLGRMALEAL